MMPEVDGFGVLAAIRERPATREIPVIVVTGQTLTEAEMARLNQGVATVLGKGLYSLEETLAHLDAALARKHKLSGEAQRLVRKAMAYLHAHYAEPLTRRAIAAHVGLDEDYLTWCFRQELGMTPIAYLNRYRVNQAKQLLKQTDQSVTAIALEVGFADSGYFSRVFRREVGVAPEAFRRRVGTIRVSRLAAYVDNDASMYNLFSKLHGDARSPHGETRRTPCSFSVSLRENSVYLRDRLLKLWRA